MIAIPGINVGAVDLTQFEGDMEEALGIPYCQVINPRSGQTSKEISKNPKSYGLIIPKDQAEAVDFVPDASWSEELITLVIGDDEIEIDCYHTHNPSFVVVSRSQLEVQEATEQGWRYLGLGYNRGQITEFGRMVEEDTSNPPLYRRVVRYLLVFLGADGTPLQADPLALTGRGGFGGSFGKEVSGYFQEFDQAYCRATKTRGRLSAFAQAFVVHSHEISFFKADKKMGYTCVAGRIFPIPDESKAGESTSIDRGDRAVNLTSAPVGSLMFPKDSETGKKISQWVSECPDFAKPNRGRDDTTAEAELFSATGVIEAPEFQANGNCKAMLVHGDEQQSIVLPPSLQECLDVAGSYTVSGVKQGGVVVAESVVLSSGPVVAAASLVDDIDY